MSDTGCPRYDYSELFWFGTITGGPKTVQPPSTYPCFFFYDNVEKALLDMLIKYFSGKNGAERYFQSIKKISILICIAGRINNFDNKAGIYSLRYTKAKHDLSFDLHVTEEQWADKSPREYQTCFAELMRQGLQKCLERAKKIKGEVLDESAFVDRYEAAIKEFLETTYQKDDRPVLSKEEMAIIFGDCEPNACPSDVRRGENGGPNAESGAKMNDEFDKNQTEKGGDQV